VNGAAGPAISVDHLTKAYGSRPVVDDVSFEVRAGETFALLGPNGAGKTTTVEILEGFRTADAGTARVLGQDPARAGRDHRARVGLMLQGGGGVDPRMEVEEAIRLYGRLHRRPRRTAEVIALVGLGHVAGARTRRLSGGERQRLGLALALVGRPDVLFLDEPTAGLDIEGRAELRSLLSELRGEGVAILLTSHDLTDVERVADRIAVMDRGRLLAIGSPSELATSSSAPVRFRLDERLTPDDLGILNARLREFNPAARVADEGGGSYVLDGLTPDPGVVATLANWLASRDRLILELRAGGSSLEELYLELIGGHRADSASRPGAPG
jgi:ABC-2 type transport system ATP-binding protein